MHTIIKSDWKVGCLSQRSHRVGNCSNKRVPFSSSWHSVPKNGDGKKKGKSHIHHWIWCLSPWVASVMSGKLPLCYLYIWKRDRENASATFHSDAHLKIEKKKGKGMWIYFKVGVVSNQMLDDHQVPSFRNGIKCHLGLLFQLSKCFDIPIKGAYQNVAIAPLECPSSGQTGVICPPNCSGWLNGVKCKFVGHFSVLLHQIQCDECDVKKHSGVISIKYWSAPSEYTVQ